MAISIAARKQKGRRLQQFIRDRILDLFPELTDRDVRSTPMGVSGDDIQLSELGSNLFPYSVEAKNVEKLNFWSAIKESESNNRDLEPLLVFKRNNTDTYCILKFDHFMKLLEQIKECNNK